MMYIRPYQKLIVWQEAHKLNLWIYQLVSALPKDERYRLIHQMCKSAQSVPMNIAEGSTKKSPKERNHFYEISAGSLEELHYQCFFAKDLHFISEERFSEADKTINRVSFLLTRLRQATH